MPDYTKVKNYINSIKTNSGLKESDRSQMIYHLLLLINEYRENLYVNEVRDYNRPLYKSGKSDLLRFLLTEYQRAFEDKSSIVVPPRQSDVPVNPNIEESLASVPHLSPPKQAVHEESKINNEVPPSVVNKTDSPLQIKATKEPKPSTLAPPPPSLSNQKSMESEVLSSSFNGSPERKNKINYDESETLLLSNIKPKTIEPFVYEPDNSRVFFELLNEALQSKEKLSNKSLLALIKKHFEHQKVTVQNLLVNKMMPLYESEYQTKHQKFTTPTVTLPPKTKAIDPMVEILYKHIEKNNDENISSLIESNLIKRVQLPDLKALKFKDTSTKFSFLDKTQHLIQALRPIIDARGLSEKFDQHCHQLVEAIEEKERLALTIQEIKILQKLEIKSQKLKTQAPVVSGSLGMPPPPPGGIPAPPLIPQPPKLGIPTPPSLGVPPPPSLGGMPKPPGIALPGLPGLSSKPVVKQINIKDWEGFIYFVIEQQGIQSLLTIDHYCLVDLYMKCLLRYGYETITEDEKNVIEKMFLVTEVDVDEKKGDKKDYLMLKTSLQTLVCQKIKKYLFEECKGTNQQIIKNFKILQDLFKKVSLEEFLSVISMIISGLIQKQRAKFQCHYHLSAHFLDIDARLLPEITMMMSTLDHYYALLDKNIKPSDPQIAFIMQLQKEDFFGKPA